MARPAYSENWKAPTKPGALGISTPKIASTPVTTQARAKLKSKKPVPQPSSQVQATFSNQYSVVAATKGRACSGPDRNFKPSARLSRRLDVQRARRGETPPSSH